MPDKSASKRTPVIVDALRTPVGKYGGNLKDVRPDDLAALVIKKLLERNANVNPSEIEDVMLGCANGAGEDNRNVARMALLLAGLPQSVAGVTINRLCGSSMDAVIQAARAIEAGDGEIYIAGGVESMSRSPYSVPKNTSGQTLFGNLVMYDTALGWRYPNPKMEAMFPLESMGETAENVAERYHISRDAQDAFALESHHKALHATSSGILQQETIAVEIPQRKGEAIFVSSDEGPRKDTTLEKLSALPPAFRKGGSVTAGNSSSLNDGAAALLMMSESKAKRLRLKPLGTFIAGAVAGVDPRVMGIGPVPATRKALLRAGLQVSDLDVIELNEAFAAQSLAVMNELSLDPKKVNPNGGAIAIGHPLGMSGARLVTTLLYEMRRKNHRYGLATMCIGVGQGIAAVFENQ